MKYELMTQYDSRKSFGHKAIVDDDGETKTLTSYLTDVAKVKDGKLTLLPAWNSSATTYRHVVEFAKQTGTYGQLVEAKKGVHIGHGNYPSLIMTNRVSGVPRSRGPGDISYGQKFNKETIYEGFNRSAMRI